MKIKVLNSVTNQIIELEVEPTTSVDVMKLKLSASQNLNYNLMTLSFQGQTLKNSSATTSSVGLVEGSQLILNIQKSFFYLLK